MTPGDIIFSHHRTRTALALYADQLNWLFDADTVILFLLLRKYVIVLRHHVTKPNCYIATQVLRLSIRFKSVSVEYRQNFFAKLERL